MAENALTPAIRAWLDALASDAPAPGGGAAAAMGGAIGGALVSMVARFTLKRPPDEAVAARARVVLEASGSLRDHLTGLIAADAAAFEAVSAAYRMPKGSQSERAGRTATIQHALAEATAVPLQIADAARSVIMLAHTIAEIGPRSLVSDAGAAAVMAQGAARAALLNVDANIAILHDAALRSRSANEAARIRRDLDDLADQVVALVRERQSHA